MYSPFIHPDKVIARGSAILSTLFVITLISSFATVDAAVRSNVVGEYVINPSIQAYNSFVEEVERQAAEDAAEEARNREFNRIRNEARQRAATNSATVRTEININNGSETTTPQQQQQPQVNIRYETVAPSQNSGGGTSGTQSYEEWKKEVDARAAQSQAEYDERVKQMNEDYEADVKQMQEESKKSYEEAVAKQNAEFEAKKAEMGF